MGLLSIIARLVLDKSGFDAGLNAANKKVSALGSSMKASLASAFSVAAISAYAKHLIDFGSKINDVATKTGIGTKELQEFTYAAKQNGAELEDVAKAFKALSLARQEALMDPHSKAAQAFGAMGMSRDDIKNMSLEDTFLRIANTIKTTDFGASELAIVSELLGKAGGNLIPAFVEGLEKAAEEANRLGIIISQEDIKALDEAGDAVSRLAAEFQGPLAHAVAGIAGFLTEMLKDLKEMVNYAADFAVGFADAKDEPPDMDWITTGRTGKGPKGAGIATRLEKAQQFADDAMDERDAGDIADAATKASLDVMKLFANIFNGGGGREKRNFDFEKITDPKAVKGPEAFHAQQGNALGRIGAYTGGKTDKTPQQLDKIQQEISKLRVTMEQRGIRIQPI